MTRPPRRTVVLECVDEEPADAWPSVPFEVRLKKFLKVMLRAHRIRCKRLCDGAKVEIVLKLADEPKHIHEGARDEIP